MALRSTKHPLFARLDQREEILRQTQPATLCIEAETHTIVADFTKLFDLPIEEQHKLFCADGSNHTEAFTRLLRMRNLPEQLSLLCAFIDRLFDFDFFTTTKALMTHSDDITKACSNILAAHGANHQHHPFLVRTILLILGTLLSEEDIVKPADASQAFLNTVITLLTSGLPQATLALDGLKRFLRCDGYRVKFVEADGVNLLIQLMKGSSKQSGASKQTDTLYHVLFCIWALTFSVDGCGYLSRPEFVNELTKLLLDTKPESEEIVRLCTQIISQLNASQYFIESAYDADLVRIFRGFINKHYIDMELDGQIQQAAEDLHNGLKKLSLWDKYVREVESGTLRNTQSHKSEIFWKQNIERFGENEYIMLTKLKELLGSQDEETVIVACHDLGEYAARHPLGRTRLEKLGAKDSVMLLLGSKSQKIQREALRTTQYLLLRSN